MEDIAELKRAIDKAKIEIGVEKKLIVSYKKALKKYKINSPKEAKKRLLELEDKYEKVKKELSQIRSSLSKHFDDLE